MPSDLLTPLLSLLEGRVGLRLQGSAPQVLGAFDALAHRLQISAAELLRGLTNDSALLEELATQLTIAETHFFRVKPQIDALIQTVLPDLERRAAGKRRLSFWSAGCSTGEEAYTLAILAAQEVSAQVELAIFGTDLHPQSLETARCGRYGAWSFRDTPACVRDRFFTEIPPGLGPAQSREPSSTQSRDQSTRWQIDANVRQIVRFEALNLLSADWSHLEDFDLILCRNVMIYFSNATAQALIERLAARLQPGGWLILGPSDPPPLPITLERSGLTVRFERGAMLYQKLAADQPSASAPSLARPELPPSEGLLGLNASMPAVAIAPSHTVAPTPDFELQLQLGMNALEAADLPAALRALRCAVYLEPQSALAQFLLAKTLLDSAQPDRARVALRQAQRWLPNRDGDSSSDSGSDSSSDLQRAVTALSVVLGES